MMEKDSTGEELIEQQRQAFRVILQHRGVKSRWHSRNICISCRRHYPCLARLEAEDVLQDVDLNQTHPWMHDL